MINIKGTLTDPTGQASIGCLIRFTSLDNSGDTLGTMTGTIRTGLDGSYDFALVTGLYEIQVNHCKKYSEIATVKISNSHSGDKTLQQLIKDCVVG